MQSSSSNVSKVSKDRLGKINKSGGLSKDEKKKIKQIRKQRNGDCRGRAW